MPRQKPFLRVFTEPGPLVALAVAIALLVGIVGPASAQFFNFGNFGGPPQRPAPRSNGGWFGGEFFAPYQQQAPQRAGGGFFRAPAAAKRDTGAERNVLGLRDPLADWPAFCLGGPHNGPP